MIILLSLNASFCLRLGVGDAFFAVCYKLFIVYYSLFMSTKNVSFTTSSSICYT